ncbi:MAG: hypothetical protein AAFQ54_13515 [Pseudomonadota bacterium]
MDCTFDRECIAGEACSVSAFEASVTTDAGAARAMVETVFGTFPGLYSNTAGTAPHNVTAFVSETGDSLHLTYTDEAAWLTFHMPAAEMAITYLGACK